jgi:hypothetical protein
MEESGPIPHGSALWPAAKKFVASLSQIVPIVPVLPTLPTRKYCAVYNLRFELFHGMEEVVGSIPTRSTKSLLESIICNSD